jgi:hypothetical protein
MLHDFDTDTTTGLTEDWDRSPSKITWAQDGKALYLTTEDKAFVKVFKLDLVKGGEPIVVDILERGSVTGISVLPTPVVQHAPPETPDATTLLVSHNSMVHANRVSLYKAADGTLETLTDLAGKELSAIEPGLDAGEGSWFLLWALGTD